MKKLALCLGVIVYLNSGKVLSYPNAHSTCTDAESGGLFDGGHSASMIYVSTESSYACTPFRNIIASFPVSSVERIEIK